MSLGSLLILDWFVVELVLIGYCLYDVFYHPALVPPKNTFTHIARLKDDSTIETILAMPIPIDNIRDTEYLTISCFDALPLHDTAVIQAGAPADTLKIYDIDSVDVKPDLGDAYPITISTLKYFLPIDYAIDTIKFTILINLDTNCSISDISIEPYHSNYNILIKQLQLALLKTKIKSPAMLNNKAVACQYRIPIYISMK